MLFEHVLYHLRKGGRAKLQEQSATAHWFGGAYEMHINNEKRIEVGDHIDFYIGKGKKKRKVNMLIKEDGVSFYNQEKILFVDL